MVPDHWIDEKIAHDLGYLLEAPKDPLWHEFGLRIHGILSQALRDMNQMSPDDPFWRGTNKEPTFHKLPQRYAALHDASPADPWLRYVLWANDWGLTGAASYMVPMIAQDITEVSWVAFGLTHGEWRTGSEVDVAGFSKIMEEVGRLRGSWRQDLERLTEDSRPLIRTGAQDALAFLSGVKRIRPIPHLQKPAE